MSLTAAATISVAEWTLPERVHAPLVYWILVSSVTGYSVMTLATRHLPASQVSAFICLQPFFGTAMAVFKLGEKARVRLCITVIVSAAWLAVIGQ